jgi:hypothetical protein
VVKTFGWDTAFILHFDDVNAAIAAANVTPPTFEQQLTIGGSPWSVSGTFDPWRLTGGSADTLEMTLPMRTVKVAGGTISEELQDLPVIVQFELQKVPQGNATPTSGPNTLQPTDFTLTPPAYPTNFPLEAKLAFQQAMPDWLAANASKIALAFATVDLDRKVSEGQQGIQWLLPTDTSYAVGQTDEGDYLFGVLSMVDGHSPVGNTQVLDPTAPTSPGRGSFLISQSIVLDNMVRPGLAAIFGATPDKFDMRADGTEIGSNTELTMANFKISDTETRVATMPIGGIVVRVDASDLALELTGVTYEYSYDIEVMVNSSSTHAFKYQNSRIDLELTEITTSASASSGKAALGISIATAVALEVLVTAIGAGIGSRFRTADPGEVELATNPQGQQQPTGAIAPTTQAVPAGGSSSVGAPSATTSATQQAATELANPAAPTDQTGFFGRMNPKVKGALVAAGVGGVIGAVISSIPAMVALDAQGKADDLPTLQTFLETAVSTVVWPANVQFTPDNVTLDGCLVIHGAIG